MTWLSEALNVIDCEFDHAEFSLIYSEDLLSILVRDLCNFFQQDLL